ncbi:MAG TPA: metallophosphoesterase family protein [Armatimonadota bacterium]|nr:metallophosphoesterase family protein [Armatimonadota bacterium]
MGATFAVCTDARRISAELKGPQRVRWLLLSDLHANLEALEAVLRDAEARWGSLRVACAGDVVGFGPSPNECIALLRERDALCVAGNHDLMVLERIAPRCTPDGLRAVEWTRARLDRSSREWLATLPTAREVSGSFVLCHGALEDPDHYIVDDADAQAQLSRLEACYPGIGLMVCGHTHRAVWAPAGRVRRANAGACFSMAPSVPALVNPGSVGQSRTLERSARYAVLDTAAGTVEYCAVAYDHAACARKIRAAGLETKLYVTLGALLRRRIRRGVGRTAEWLSLRPQSP